MLLMVNKIPHPQIPLSRRSELSKPFSLAAFGEATNIPRDILVAADLDLKTVFPLVGTLGNEWVPEVMESSKSEGAINRS